MSLEEQKQKLDEERLKKQQEEEKKLLDYERDDIGIYKVLTFIAGLEIKYGTRKTTQQQLQRFTRELEFMNLKWIERISQDGSKKIEDMFTMGVVTHKSALMPVKNDRTNSFVKFEISDLRKYDDIITQMTKGKNLWKTEYETFKKFKLSESGYKVVNWILFGEVAQKLNVSYPLFIYRTYK
jgi:hypothetical protein